MCVCYVCVYTYTLLQPKCFNNEIDYSIKLPFEIYVTNNSSFLFDYNAKIKALYFFLEGRIQNYKPS